MDPWIAVKSYFANGVRRMVDHQVDSYEDFVRNKLPLIIQSTPPITVWHEQDPNIKKYKYEFRLSFEKVTYMKPRIQEATGRVKPMLPMEARVRNFTYAAQMYADVRFTARTYKGPNLDTFDEESRVFEGISLGKLPVMLGSSLCLLKDYPLSLEQYGECAHDPLGYFIIHGSERTILCQEKVADNRIMVFQAKKTVSKHTYSVEMKSLHESFTMPPKKLEIRLSSKFNGFGYPLLACVPRFREDIPVAVYFRALGVTTDEAIAKLVGSDDHVELLAASFRDCAELGVFTQDDAVLYLSNHLQYGTNQEDKCAYVRQLLNSEYLPHVRFAGETVSPSVHNARKCVLTASMIRRILLTEKRQIPLDDRDSYPNKRVVTTGALLTHLFRQLFQKVCNDTRNSAGRPRLVPEQARGDHGCPADPPVPAAVPEGLQRHSQRVCAGGEQRCVEEGRDSPPDGDPQHQQPVQDPQVVDHRGQVEAGTCYGKLYGAGSGHVEFHVAVQRDQGGCLTGARSHVVCGDPVSPSAHPDAG